jgi:hypothetical protein
MTEALLFVLYFILLLFLFYYLGGKMLPWISFRQAAAIFSIRVFLGCLYGYIFLHIYGGDDTWNFFQDSIPEKAKLFHHPLDFFGDFLPRAAFAEAHSFSEGISFYLRNLEYWILVKSLAVFDILSFSHYYVDVIFFEFMTIWGPILLLKLLDSYFPPKRIFLLLAIFFIPSIGFWLSGIRAEAMILLAIGIILYHTQSYRDKKNGSSVIWIVLAFLGFIVFRVEFLALFLPAYICWLITLNNKRRPTIIYLGVYGFCLLIFLLSLLISPRKNLATPMVRSQQNFMALHGNTRLPLDSLHANISGFVKVFPQAFANSFLRPWITEAKGALQIFSSLEIMASWILLLLSILVQSADRWKMLSHPLILLFIYYGITQILLIGFLVPFPGAIIRYKSIPELLLVLSIGLSINWNSLHSRKI